MAHDGLPLAVLLIVAIAVAVGVLWPKKGEFAEDDDEQRW
jgi:hypothetical protein